MILSAAWDHRVEDLLVEVWAVVSISPRRVAATAQAGGAGMLGVDQEQGPPIAHQECSLRQNHSRRNMTPSEHWVP